MGLWVGFDVIYILDDSNLLLSVVLAQKMLFHSTPPFFVLLLFLRHTIVCRVLAFYFCWLLLLVSLRSLQGLSSL